MIAGGPPQKSEPGPTATKRSLFNRPSWSKPQQLTEGTDLFHRSNQTYIDHAAELERQRKRKLARKERERASRADSEERTGKRRRVSDSDDDDDDDDNGFTSDESFHKSDSKSHTEIPSVHPKNQCITRAASLPQPECSPSSLLKRDRATAKELKLDQGRKTATATIIDLEDEEAAVGSPSEVPAVAVKAAKPQEAPIPEDEPFSDEEFPELARQARERARRKRLEEAMVSSTPDPFPVSQDGSFQYSPNPNQATPLPLQPDPILQILITSTIPDTKPLIVTKKISQRLKDVRLAWVERQQICPEIMDKVFLTWRGKRLFDVTSCRSLGIGSGPMGRISAKGDNVIDDEGHIHMEAMTAEMMEAYKKAKICEAQPESEDTNQDAIIQEQPAEPQVKIICKAKGFPDFKLIVKSVSIQLSCRYGLGSHF